MQRAVKHVESDIVELDDIMRHFYKKDLHEPIIHIYVLLVELEDLNPYLSILELDEAKRNTFIADMIDALNGML